MESTAAGADLHDTDMGTHDNKIVLADHYHGRLNKLAMIKPS